MGFALFSLGEYANMLLMSSFNAILFFGGWMMPSSILDSFFPISIWFGFKICFFVILFIVMRAALPRYRYDQLMYLGWKCFLPLSLAYLILLTGVLVSFNYFPL
jgi:NADH-quinone oxidoreductase subunit H